MLFENNPNVSPYLDEDVGISIVSEIEMLSFNGLTAEDEKIIKSLISDCKVFQLNNEIKEKAIYIRRTYRNKLPDAIIAATAIVKDLTLLTADKDFNKISELKMVLLQP